VPEAKGVHVGVKQGFRALSFLLDQVSFNLLRWSSVLAQDLRRSPTPSESSTETYDTGGSHSISGGSVTPPPPQPLLSLAPFASTKNKCRATTVEACSGQITMSDTKKKLFGLFRSRSVSEKKSRDSPPVRYTRAPNFVLIDFLILIECRTDQSSRGPINHSNPSRTFT
jgi:hypothetical protein